MTTARAAIGFALVLATTGPTGPTACVKLDKDFPEKRFFLVDATRPGEPGRVPGGPLGRALEVARFSVSPKCETREMVHKIGESDYRTDFYNQFFLDPGDMLAEPTRRWLARSGLFEHVLIESSRIEATHVLEGAINAMYGDYSDGIHPKAALRMQFALIEDRGSAQRVVREVDLGQEVPLESATPEALVKGWEKCLTLILTALETELRKAASD